MVGAFLRRHGDVIDDDPGRSTSAPSRPARRRRKLWVGAGFIVVVLVAGLVVAMSRLPVAKDPLAEERADARLAVKALVAGDLVALERHLSANRGGADFAFFFTADVTPRLLGDALSSVVDGGGDAPLRAGIDPHAYDVTLTDLAGTLALATYGDGDRRLPARWTRDFVDATTTPTKLFGEARSKASPSERRRAAQDQANKQNLLLLLARGQWSRGFLKDVTEAYWTFDRAAGDDAWPGPNLESARYAPSPTGDHLTDGMLALTAALTANPAASAWAFTDFKPDLVTVKGSDRTVGEFTHYLLFERQFPTDAEGESIGQTAVLTALSSAIDAKYGTNETVVLAAALGEAGESGPLHDVGTLRALAKELSDESGCSWNPADYPTCAKAAASALWGWIQRWGHSVLDILSLATFAPPPFTAIGVTAAATNATWHAIGGDFAQAGLSLATAVPGLVFTKIASSVKAGDAARKAATQAEEVAEAATAIRAGAASPANRELSEAGAQRVVASKQPGYRLEREAQDEYAERVKGETEVRLDPACTTTCVGGRRVDVIDRRGRCIEVKRGVGSGNFRHEQTQIAKDLLLRGSGACRAVRWDFYPDINGSVGPHASLRDALQSSGIPYRMAVPKVVRR